MSSQALRDLRRINTARDDLLRLGWYHSFRFDDGTEFVGILSVETSERRYAQFPIPRDLTGKTVLDIGAWDGWFSFEAERRGAAVTAVDLLEVPNFHKVHKKLDSRVAYRELDLFELPHSGLPQFDYVFFLGVLYHTKYPLLALEIVCGRTKEIAIVESYVTDAVSWRDHNDDIPTLEFYETDELGGQLDNWVGPTVGALAAMSRAAGFARVEVLDVYDNRAALACYRHWAAVPLTDSPQARLISVKNTLRAGINFRAAREEYITWWFECDEPVITRADIRLEVGESGVGAMHVSRGADGRWAANSRLPPYLSPGWYPVRLSICNGRWSDPLRIAVDLASETSALLINTLCDGVTWERDRARLTPAGAFLSLWITGLTDTSDEANTSLWIDGEIYFPATFVGPPDVNAARQVNCVLPADTPPGMHKIHAYFAGVESPSRNLELFE